MALTAILGTTAVAFSACSITPSGHVSIGDYWVGKYVTTSGGILVDLFRHTGTTPGGQKYLGVSQLMLDKYLAERRAGHNYQGAATLTLRWARQFCTGSFSSKCDQATNDDQWSDFRGALTEIYGGKNNGGCLAPQFRSGTDWQSRPLSDANCI